VNAEEWLEIGWRNGWCSAPVCAVHDGLPMTVFEEEEDDPCIHVVRLYEDTATKEQVEMNHSPSVWRASNRGWDA
jgi:hypothetical protein